MFMNVQCPTCGFDCREPESSLGQPAKCPACSKLYQCGSLSPRSLKTYPLEADESSAMKATPQTRAAPVHAHELIHYRCSRCSKSLESPAGMAGQKLNCPDCGQRLQIPQGSASAAAPVNKVVPARDSLPTPSSAYARVAETPSEPPGVAKKKPPSKRVPAAAPPAPKSGRRENCLECGVDIAQRQRVQTCPDCGSPYCSARCYRDHQHHAHPSQ